MVQFQVTTAELLGPVNVKVVVVQDGIMTVTISRPPAGIEPLDCTVTFLLLVDADQFRATLLELLVKVIVHERPPFWFWTQAPFKGSGPAVIVGGGWTVSKTDTVVVRVPIVIVMLS